ISPRRACADVLDLQILATEVQLSRWGRKRRLGQGRAMQFLRFRIDPANQCLWRRGDSAEDERVLLTPKAYVVLDYLLKHAGRLVRQDELLEALWPQSYVQPEVLKHHVLEIRKALEDDARS